MREIIFRGKTIQWNEWVYGDLINYRDNDKRILEQNLGAWNILECGHEVIPESVGQWTGLKDQNEIKIFEGDICSTADNEDNSFSGGEIVFDEDLLAYLIYETNSGWRYLDVIKHLEVVGNIFDNKDLLEEGK